MQYIGEYKYEIKNGAVKIPWKIEELKNAKWVLMKTKYDGDVYVDLFIYVLNQYSAVSEENQSQILCEGALNLSDNFLWNISKEIQKYLDGNEIIFIGLGYYIQILPIKYVDYCEATRDK